MAEWKTGQVILDDYRIEKELGRDDIGRWPGVDSQEYLDRSLRPIAFYCLTSAPNHRMRSACH
jgi:hypothetical protein